MGTIQAVREFMLQEFSEAGFDNRIADDDSLIDTSILDSLGILSLIAFLDEQFGIVPSENELDPKYFETIELIGKFIDSKIAKR